MDDRSAKKSTNNMWDKLKNTTTAMKYARAKFRTGKKDKSGESTSFATRASFGTAASSLRVAPTAVPIEPTLHFRQNKKLPASSKR